MSNKERTFSIILTVYDQAREVESNLPSFLNQEYIDGFEVIVVDESSTDNTKDVLTLLKHDYPHLYTTFLPKPNRLISRPKLAYTIGVKAAKKDWIVIASVDKPPIATDILQAVADTIDPQTDIMLGYVKNKQIRLQAFNTLEDASLEILKTERKPGRGHLGKRMRYTRGQYDFVIVRKEQAHEMLKLFEEKISRGALMSLRLRVCMQQMLRRSSSVVLTSE